jgi:hypothetical protein
MRLDARIENTPPEEALSASLKIDCPALKRSSLPPARKSFEATAAS